MSIYKAKEMFKDGLKYIDPKKDPATYDILAGLYQLTEGIEQELRDIDRKIAHVSQQIDYLPKR